MTGSGELGDGHHNDGYGLTPQVDGPGDGKKKGKRGTPKKATPKKGSGVSRFTPTTPRRKGHDGGSGGANAVSSARSTRSSTTVNGISFSCNVDPRRVTNTSDIYTGPPAAAFTTLRLEGSVPFRVLLHQLKKGSQQTVSPGASLGFSATSLQEQDHQALGVRTDSPPDSAIDVLTPTPCLASTSNDNKHFTQEIEDMAPVRETNQAERNRLRERDQQIEVLSDSLKDVIHNYYEVQAQVQGYVSETETRDVLVNKMQELSQSLTRLARESSSNTITNTFVPPEVVDYVDDGRNPDIYRRDLVEVVQRGNAVLNGKMNAFGSFSKTFADDVRRMSPEMAKAVDEIMGVSGDGAEVALKQENGGNHQS